MRPIHKITSNEMTRPAQQYMRVKGGYVWATNNYCIIRIPVCEVFGKDVIADDEELYFEAKQWATAKMPSASDITREGDLFTAYSNKRAVLGMVKALSAEKFDKEIGRFPDCAAVIPDLPREGKPTNVMSFNPQMLQDVAAALGYDIKATYYLFDTPTRMIILKSTDEDLKGFGGVMPQYIKGITAE